MTMRKLKQLPTRWRSIPSGLVFFVTLLAWPGIHEAAPLQDQDAPQIFTTRSTPKSLPLAKDEDCFHFVIYGDRTGGPPEGIKVLEQAVKDTNLLDPDLVMTVGDLIQGYNETPEWMVQMQEYHSVMKKLNMKWFPVAGNHDVYWRGNGPAPQGQHESNYEKHFGPLWYSFKHKNTGFVVLYSDEGDPETNRKAFNIGKLQNMSEEQLAFLDKALLELKDADHVMVFLHHPRWIGGGYTGNNWEEVHSRLKKAGNVSAVFAGHIHRMRFDGPRDGIEYYALATTGGGLGADFPEAGYLHHFNVVTVRKEKVSVATIPVGGVMNPKEFTKEFLAEVDQARSIRPRFAETSPTLQVDGSVDGKISFELSNPCPRNVNVTVALETPAQDNNWTSNLGHQHFELATGQTKKIEFVLKRSAGKAELASLPRLVLNSEYLGQSARIRIPELSIPIRLLLGQVDVGHFQGAVNQSLDISGGDSAVRVNSDQFDLPRGPMTMEAWVKPKSLVGYNAIIAKTEGSEYAMFSDEGVPQFDIHIGGKYVTAKATDKLKPGVWAHLAGVFDGKEVRMYVDGKLVGTAAGSGPRRRNALPLFIGADPNRRAQPTRPLPAFIDEVRISRSARYQMAFEPKKRFTPDETRCC